MYVYTYIYIYIWMAYLRLCILVSWLMYCQFPKHIKIKCELRDPCVCFVTGACSLSLSYRMSNMCQCVAILNMGGLTRADICTPQKNTTTAKHSSKLYFKKIFLTWVAVMLRLQQRCPFVDLMYSKRVGNNDPCVLLYRCACQSQHDPFTWHFFRWQVWYLQAPIRLRIAQLVQKSSGDYQSSR